MKISGDMAVKLVLGALVLGGGIYLVWSIKRSASNAAGSVLDAATEAFQYINPASDKNIAYQSANAIGAALTGDEHFNVGVKVFEAGHPNEVTGRPVMNAPITQQKLPSILLYGPQLQDQLVYPAYINQNGF